MGRSKDIASGSKFVDTTGDTMTGNLGVNGYIDLNTSGNRAKLGYDSNNVYIGSTSGTGALYFKNNITSSDAPHSSGDNKMIIADNAVTMPNQPSFKAFRQSGWNSFGNTNNNLMPLNSTTHNVGSHYDTTNYKFTCPVAGSYFFGAQMYSDGTDWGEILIRVNGSILQAFANARPQSVTVTASQVLQLAASDYVEMLGRVNNTDSNDWYGTKEYTYFQGMLLG